jgi:hypothetical protein
VSASPRKGEEAAVVGDDEDGGQTGEDVARTVWRFVQAAGVLVGELDDEDELRLLRVRTRKNELVVVPSEYIFLDGHSLAGLGRCWGISIGD